MKRELALAAATTTIGFFGIPVVHEALFQPSPAGNLPCESDKAAESNSTCRLGSTGIAGTKAETSPQAAPPVPAPEQAAPVPVQPAVPETAVPTAPIPPQPATEPVPPAAPPAVPAAPAPADRKFEPGRIYVLGDSLSVGTSKSYLGKQSLEAKLARNGWTDVRTRAACGRPLTGRATYTSCDNGRPTRLTGLEQLKSDIQYVDRAEAVVVALGSNDYAQNPWVFKKAARSLIARIKTNNPAVRIFWPDIYLRGRGESYKRINNVIGNLGVKRINIAGNSAHYYGAGSDGIHPTAAGYINRSSRISNTVGSPAG